MKKLLTLSCLYFAQGLPFGFQAGAFPLLLRERGASLASIGFAGLLSAPWLFKPLWAPLVDRYGFARLGRRKSWILPLQLALCLLCCLAAQTRDLRALSALIFALNLLAATQDIAVDGLAIGWLEPSELGPANAVQVVGYKLGMLTGGGLLVWASGRIGWSGLFYAMAGLMLGVFLVSWTVPEGDVATPETERFSMRELLARLWRALLKSESAALIAVVATYKTGESMADAMWKPLLLDRGFSSSEIGLWAGSYGMLASLLGSALSGALTRKGELPRALLWIAIVRALGVAGEWWVAELATPSAASVIAVTCVEHFVGGALTTVLFALMMRSTDRAIGATHYTLLAGIEVWGKVPFSAVSGVVAQKLGYEALFASATGLCVGFAWLVQRLQRRLLGAAPVRDAPRT